MKIPKQIQKGDLNKSGPEHGVVGEFPADLLVLRDELAVLHGVPRLVHALPALRHDVVQVSCNPDLFKYLLTYLIKTVLEYFRFCI